MTSMTVYSLEDDESTAAVDFPVPPGSDDDIVAPDDAVTVAVDEHRRAATPPPHPDDDPGHEVLAAFAGRPPTAGGAPAIVFKPETFDEDPDTRYNSEIPGKRHTLPRLDSDIEDAIDAALSGDFLGDDDGDGDEIDEAEILAEADAEDADLMTASAESANNESSGVYAIPNTIPSESAYRPLTPQDDDEPSIHIIRGRTASVAPIAPAPAPPPAPVEEPRPLRPTGGTYSYKRTADVDAAAAAAVALGNPQTSGVITPPIDHVFPPEQLPDDDEDLLTLDPRGAPETLEVDDFRTYAPAHDATPVPIHDAPDRMGLDDFRSYAPMHDATPVPIHDSIERPSLDDFANRLDLSSSDVPLDDVSDFNDLALAEPRDDSDLYIAADDLRSGARDASDLDRRRHSVGFDEIGDLADPPEPSEFEDESGVVPSLPKVAERAVQPGAIWESSRRHRRPETPATWNPDADDVRRVPPQQAQKTPAPAILRAQSPVMAPPMGQDFDLESALDELDVDLGGEDPVAIPRASTAAAKPAAIAAHKSQPIATRGAPSRSTPAPVKPAPARPARGMSEDGIPIDFDDLDE